ncbi:4-hydroxy-tetrahydrodipicolinate reductase [Sphingobium xenophagum]|uniref:4-hydroxy-tetrahydrodipicolinate reductase n=1 Tax=Sphingobium xenophagum TaxID=121428 RepID=A0ABU1X4I4_SPHXE|nr:4-hydroxy-tetrahydrodipicolinate reductase [Sphingobium xenophagum]
MKQYRMIQYGAGATGKFALRSILTHPQLELIGLGVHSDARVGVDAGAICRMPLTGVLASNDLPALLDLKADCVLFMPWDPYAGDVSDPTTHSGQLFETLCRFLESGKNVIASAPNSLVYAPHLGAFTMDRLEAACRNGGASFLYGGISPGFASDRLVLALTQCSARIDTIHVREIMNYANYGDRDTIMGLYGFGMEAGAFDPSGILESFQRGLGGSVAMIADALKVSLDRIQMEFDHALSPHNVEIAAGLVRKGTIAAEVIRAKGIVGGEPRIVAEHVTRIDDNAAPDWPQFGGDGKEGYQIEVRGAPAMKVDFELGAFGRNPMADAGWAVGGHLTNSVIGLCEAEQGVRTFMDLPLALAAHRMTV